MTSDYIFSSLHKQYTPTPSTLVGETGSLRRDWDGSKSVLDEMKRASDDELNGLLTFERTRVNHYSDFVGGQDTRIRGGNSEMTKIFGRVNTGGVSQEYRNAIMGYLKDKKNIKTTKGEKMTRQFKQNLDQMQLAAQRNPRRLDKLVANPKAPKAPNRRLGASSADRVKYRGASQAAQAKNARAKKNRSGAVSADAARSRAASLAAKRKNVEARHSAGQGTDPTPSPSTRDELGSGDTKENSTVAWRRTGARSHVAAGRRSRRNPASRGPPVHPPHHRHKVNFFVKRMNESVGGEDDDSTNEESFAAILQGADSPQQDQEQEQTQRQRQRPPDGPARRRSVPMVTL